jgi:hypothetical protein
VLGYEFYDAITPLFGKFVEFVFKRYKRRDRERKPGAEYVFGTVADALIRW